MKPAGTGMQMLAVGRWRVWEIWVGTDGVCHRLPRLAPSSAFHTWLETGQSHAFLDVLELGNEDAEWVSVLLWLWGSLSLTVWINPGFYGRKWGRHTKRSEHEWRRAFYWDLMHDSSCLEIQLNFHSEPLRNSLPFCLSYLSWILFTWTQTSSD